MYKSGAMYKISCKDCSCVYIGETNKCFNTCLSVHKHDLKPVNLANLKEDDLNNNKKLHWLNIVLNVKIGSIL